MIADEAGLLYRLAPAGIDAGSAESAAYHLACWDVSRKIIEAWERDISRGMDEALATKESFETEDWPEWGKVRQAIKWMLSGLNWRRSLFHPPTLVGRAPITTAEADRRRHAEDDFAIAQAKAFLIVLGPWLDGTRLLSYEDFASLLREYLGAALSESRHSRVFGAERPGVLEDPS